MSGVNITILEGGKAENFGQVTKLRTSNGADHDLWVPKSDVETKHLSVKKNGLHYTNQYTPTASEKKDGKFHDIYGWDTITVSVKKKVTGKKKKTSPSTGIEYDAPTSIDVDDDGNLVETELPVYIEIEEPPDKLEYRDGESISKTGMVVKAYYADDREWGTVPNNETTLDPSTASGEGGGSGDIVYPAGSLYKIQFTDGTFLALPSTENPIIYSAGVDYSVVLPNIIAGVSSSSYPAYDFQKTDKNGNVWRFYGGTGSTGIYVNGRLKWSTSRGGMILHYNANTKKVHWREYRIGIPESRSVEFTLVNGIGVNGITVSEAIEAAMKTPYGWYTVNNYNSSGFITQLEAHFKFRKDGGVIDPIVSIGGSYDPYGEFIDDIVEDFDVSQTITVGWTPPEGEEELTDTFDITVNPSN